jgi:hypothetical protein
VHLPAPTLTSPSPIAIDFSRTSHQFDDRDHRPTLSQFAILDSKLKTSGLQAVSSLE